MHKPPALVRRKPHELGIARAGGSFLLSLGVFPCALGHRTSRMRGVWPSTRAADPSPCGPLLASALRPLTAQRFRIPHLLSNELGAWLLSAYCCYVHLSAPDWGCHSAATLRATTCNNVQHACNIRATYVQHPPVSITFLHKVRMCCYKIENSYRCLRKKRSPGDSLAIRFLPPCTPQCQCWRWVAALA